MPIRRLRPSTHAIRPSPPSAVGRLIIPHQVALRQVGLVATMHPEQIVIKVFRSLRHDFEMLQGQDRLPLFLVRIELREGYRGLESVFDLSAVPRGFAPLVQFLVMFSRVFVNLFRFHLKCLFAFREPLQVHLPDFEGRSLV